jgi:hypothetical protein
MTSTPAHNPDIRKALVDLATVTAGFVRGCRNQRKRQVALEVIRHANQALRAGEVVQNSAHIPTDPEQLIRAYLEANGDWRSLVAAINRMALEAATRRPQ